MIPFLMFPMIVLQEVLRSMNPFELLNFSMLSSKTKRLAKEFSRNKSNRDRYKLEMRNMQGLSVSLLGNSVYWYFEPASCKLKYRLERLICDKGEVRKRKGGMTEFLRRVEYLIEILNCRISSVVLNFDVISDNIFIDFLKLHSDSIESLEIIGYKIADDKVSNVLKSIKVTQNLDMSVQISENFRFDMPRNLSQLYIQHGSGITLDDLLAIDCYTIRLRETNFTIPNLNRFILSWMAFESHKNLQYIEIQIEDVLSVSQMYNNLNGRKIHWSVIREFIVNSAVIQVIGGMDVRRTDGTIGTVFLEIHNSMKMLCMVIP